MNYILQHKESFLFFIFGLILSYLAVQDGGDFDVYLEAAYKLSHGSNPYLPPYAKDGMGYSYSPFFIILLIPFTANFIVTEFFWCLLSFVMLYRSYLIFKTYLVENQLTESQNKVWVWTMLFLSYQFVSNNIGMVQLTIFLLWAILESVTLIRCGENWKGGLLLGAAINIKIMPIVMLGYLFYRGYFKGFLIALFTSILLLFSPSIFWGFDYNMILLQDWWHIINPNNVEHQIESGIGTHSMVAFLPVFLTETVGGLPYPRNIFDLDFKTAILITQIVTLALVSVSLFYLRSLPFTKESNLLKSIWEISFFILLIPLVMPHQQKYGFLLVMPMVGYLVYYFIKAWQFHKTSKIKIVFSLFCILMIVFSPIHGSSIIGWHAFKFSQHYRFITIVTLILIPISLYLHPEKLRKTKPTS